MRISEGSSMVSGTVYFAGDEVRCSLSRTQRPSRCSDNGSSCDRLCIVAVAVV